MSISKDTLLLCLKKKKKKLAQKWAHGKMFSSEIGLRVSGICACTFISTSDPIVCKALDKAVFAL